MAPSHKSSSPSSVRSSSNIPPRRPRSPVSMYQMDYGLSAPKPARPLVKPEPKVSKSSRSPTFDSSSNHSPSLSISTSFASSNSSVGTSSTSSTKSRSSTSFFRLFGKRKASTAPPTIFEPPDPIFYPIRSPEAQASTNELNGLIHDANEPSFVNSTNDDEILEVLRESHPGHVTTHSTHSRQASLTVLPVHAPNGLRELPSALPHRPEYSRPPLRPTRNPKRPKTAPSSHSNNFRPLPQIPRNETPTFTSSNSPIISGDSNKTAPRPSQTEILDTRRIESPSLSLTRSKSISHSMVMVAPRPDSPFIDVSRPMQSYFATASGTNQSIPSFIAERSVKPQVGWSGEWNIDDMQDVIQKLRELK